MYVFINYVALIGGATAIGLAFGWQIGLGVGLLAWFIKSPER